MSLQTILTKIKDEAVQSAAELVEVAEQSAQQLRPQLEDELSQFSASLDARAVEAVSQMERKTASLLVREKKQVRLRSQQELVTEGLQGVYDALVSLDDAAYKSFLQSALATVDFPSTCTVLVPKKRVEITKSCVPAGAEIQTDDSFAGGVKIMLGNAEIDASFESIVFSECKEELMQFLAEQLGFHAA